MHQRCLWLQTKQDAPELWVVSSMGLELASVTSKWMPRSTAACKAEGASLNGSFLARSRLMMSTSSEVQACICSQCISHMISRGVRERERDEPITAASPHSLLFQQHGF